MLDNQSNDVPMEVLASLEEIERNGVAMEGPNDPKEVYRELARKRLKVTMLSVGYDLPRISNESGISGSEVEEVFRKNGVAKRKSYEDIARTLGTNLDDLPNF